MKAVIKSADGKYLSADFTWSDDLQKSELFEVTVRPGSGLPCDAADLLASYPSVPGGMRSGSVAIQVLEIIAA